MRSTVDLPPTVRRRAEQIAAERGLSLSATIAELATLGLAQLDGPVQVDIDPRSGFPVVSVGRRVTDDDVARVLDAE